MHELARCERGTSQCSPLGLSAIVWYTEAIGGDRHVPAGLTAMLCHHIMSYDQVTGYAYACKSKHVLI